MSERNSARFMYATLLLSCCVFSTAANAQVIGHKPLPDYVPMPPGFVLFDGRGRDFAVEYGRDQFDYQPAPNQSVKHVSADGHSWSASARATPAPANRLDQAAVNAFLRPLLTAQGWEILAERP